MNRVSKFATLAVGLITLASSPAVFAQASPAPAAAAPAVKPEAIPAKVGLIAFEQAVFATNEGQQAVAALGKKYEPQKTKIQGEQTEVDSLQKQLQAATTISDEDRQSRVRTIDAKQKQLQRDGEDAQAAYQNDLQEAYGRLAGKVNAVMQKYASDNGFTLVLDVSGQQSNVLWANEKTDVTRAVIEAYNAQAGVAAPAGPAPAAAPRSAAPRPAATKPPAK
ncbi:OmpH family outer membrane protein [Terriglobus sp. TAA 43]|uniref:OmpH family outer membrane protein n=1 Tax=Terriglobus sp. TAA 43 TaxID=278961 RepID=UPI0006459D64|nr:OmpH family outer membrane protein [Terriglobus sp. TAA 43]